MLLYSLTVFLGAFLLFQIEPLIGKFILPWFGGAPAVWSTCLLFFQLVLLAGYLYAHALARRASPRAARVLHGVLILLSVASLGALAVAWGSPILPGSGWKPLDPGQPVRRILLLLSASVGLPYLLLSSTSPLAQVWASRTHPGSRVYRLYALSNFASLAALVTYPTLVERLLPLRLQAWLWSGTYTAFAIASLLSLRRAGASASPGLPVSQSPGPSFTTPSSTEITNHQSPITNLFWFALAACGSMMLMATTNQMCQEVASIPFLWVLPLCLYLASFVLCFESDRFYNRVLFGPAFLAALCWAAVVLFRGFPVPIRTQIAAFSAALFTACMVCHGELARSRPQPSRLTSFYLTIAAGGAAGGIFVALIAPRLFRGFWEIHAALLLSGVLGLVALIRDQTSWLHRGRPWPAFLALGATAAAVYYARDPDLFSSALARRLSLRLLFSSGPGIFAVATGAAAILLLVRLRLLTARGRPYLSAAFLAGAIAFAGMLLVSEIRSFLQSAVSVSRNFYGVLTVERLGAGDPDAERLDLRHGRIVHGFQYKSLWKRFLPTSYYTEESGIGLALEHHPRRARGPMNVGVVGLGVGTIASYGRAGDTFRFYDINPAVIALSTGPGRLFTYLADSPAKVEIAVGDARLSLEREISSRSAPGFDVLAVDAFTSDAIPVHLLTKEAIAIDLARLAPDGILAFHISNRQLDLEPVVRGVARSLSLPICVVDKNERGDVAWATTWVLLSRDPSVLAVPEIAAACARREASPAVRLWTVDYSNLFAVMK
ncbi:MAG TPA: ferrichrome ABC transporter permease [Thermoanaerobaculia bacterium]|nr:ferrichrome ABC transporter permease [Thermoanaerobaculia bacterium]